ETVIVLTLARAAISFMVTRGDSAIRHAPANSYRLDFNDKLTIAWEVPRCPQVRKCRPTKDSQRSGNGEDPGPGGASGEGGVQPHGAADGRLRPEARGPILPSPVVRQHQ